MSVLALLFFLSFEADDSHFQVCDNVGDHLIGNVYARYEWETEAQTAVDNLNERWYAGTWQNGPKVEGSLTCLQVAHSMQSSLLSPTSVKHAVARTRTVNATGVASAILCTYAFHRKNWQAHCGTLNAWNDDSTPQRVLAVKVVGSRVPVAQMAGARVLQYGRSVGKVVERVVIATEIAAKWLVEHIPVLAPESSGSCGYI